MKSVSRTGSFKSEAGGAGGKKQLRKEGDFSKGPRTRLKTSGAIGENLWMKTGTALEDRRRGPSYRGGKVRTAKANPTREE